MRQTSRAPLGGTCKMHEQCRGPKQIVGSEEELERCDVKASGCEMEVGVQSQLPASEQNRTDVNNQEQRDVGHRRWLATTQ